MEILLKLGTTKDASLLLSPVRSTGLSYLLQRGWLLSFLTSPRPVLQKLCYKHEKLTALWPLLTSFTAQRFYVRHGRLRILGPLALIPAHRVVISCWQRQARKTSGYCSLPSRFSEPRDVTLRQAANCPLLQVQSSGSGVVPTERSSCKNRGLPLRLPWWFRRQSVWL